METTKLRRFAQYARRTLLELVEARMQLVLHAGSAARRENADAIKKLEEAIKSHNEAQVIERVAYTWFNRFCALRFMDVNRYTRIGVVSPAEGQFQPEILAEAKMGHIDEETVPEKIRHQIVALLAGQTPSHDPQGEAYRLLVVAACNAFHRAMPFLFERIDDYTELLMPDDLLSGNSILAYTREAMTPDACVDVEAIGWLYQFYISEKKDAVFEGLKKNQKITPENIPAATQLFTPHWIVRYLVENSLGRLWLLNRPGSKLAEQMDYYIQPEQSESEFLKISNPEEIKICDPACGSGHMLTYAFDLLYAIYEEEGVNPADIPEKILTHNLYGIEIDERAGELAAFALTMKARAKQRRFFNKGIKPHICVLEKVSFATNELAEYMDFIGRELFTVPLKTTLRQFEEADNFGSLIRPDVTDVAEILRILEAKDVSGQLFLIETHKNVLQVLRQTDYLSPKYHVVIANPPYMGSKGMNAHLGAWAKENYPSSKSDLYAMFIERNLDLTREHGAVAMITMQSWMFLSSFESLRERILSQNTLLSMAHLGARAFDSIGGEVVSTTAFVIGNEKNPAYIGSYFSLVDRNSEISKDTAIREAIKSPGCGWFYQVSAADFEKIPGSPIAYWVSESVFKLYSNGSNIEQVANVGVGLQTGDNGRFIRVWHEVSLCEIGFGHGNSDDANAAKKRWYPCNKGGEFRKWYGNQNDLIDWEADGSALKANVPSAVIRNEKTYFKPVAAWSKIASGGLAFRYFPEGFVHNDASCVVSANSQNILFSIISSVNSNTTPAIFSRLNPTLNFVPGQMANFPLPHDLSKRAEYYSQFGSRSIELAKLDWDAYETSWNFTGSPLLYSDYRQSILLATYQKIRTHWSEMTLELQRLEQANNRIFINAYGLQDEVKPEVPLREITLNCNPHYRYGGDKDEDELEALLLADTVRELISYAVGCMFGRYALDKPGLILADQGETIEDYLKQVPDSHFAADDDNVIPMLDGDWFTDDIAERFRKFLRVAFGEAHFEDNLQFVEKALGKNGKARDIRDYFLKDFYNDHVKRYKKRPIYWLFSSPKSSFNALIYLHRYRPDTVSVVLNGYLRDFRNKLAAHLNYLQHVGISTTASQVEKTRANKEIDSIKKQLQELDDYERDTLYPLATEQVALDLDDGVKVNYLKLGPALKKIVGLDAKGEE